MTRPLQLESFLPTDYLAEALRADVLRGLTARPKELPPKWFYDDRGSVLFDEITRLPEYYPTRAERAILETYKEEIAKFSGADSLVELGSGSGEKTRLLIEALRAQGTLATYVPMDVSPSALLESGRALVRDYPGRKSISGSARPCRPICRHRRQRLDDGRGRESWPSPGDLRAAGRLKRG